jgi:tol-pal system protein YbgF
MVTRLMARRAPIFAAIFCAIAFGGPAAAQIFGGGNDELEIQVQRLQRDVRDLQAEVFREGNTGGAQAAAALSAQRVDDIEESLRRLTGELEVMTHTLEQLSQRADRMQNQLDYMERSRTASEFSFPLDPLENGGPGAPPRGAPPGAPPNAPRGDLALAPSQGTLGTIPRSPVPSPNDFPPGAAPGFAGDPEGEFDTAMDLLTRAQYDRAREAFRSYAASYPETDRGAQALYWSADIAYSVDRDYQGAARDFAELLRQYPDVPRAPEAMLKLGLSLFALGQNEEGCVTLAALPRSYPNANETIASRARAERSNAGCR